MSVDSGLPNFVLKNNNKKQLSYNLNGPEL